MPSLSSFADACTSGWTAHCESSWRRRQISSRRTLVSVARSTMFTSRPSEASVRIGKPLPSLSLSRIASPLSPRLQRGPTPPRAIVKKELLLQDVCAFLRLHCDVSYVGPATRVADLAVASARKRALEKKRAGFLGFAGLVGKGKKKEKETEVEGSSSSTASSSSSFSSLPEPSPIQIEEGLVDLFLSLEERFDLSFSAKGDGEAKAAKAVTVAEVSALLAREIELINKSLRHIEII